MAGGSSLEGASPLLGVALFGEISGLKEVVNSKPLRPGTGSAVLWNGKRVGEVVAVTVELMEPRVVVEDALRSAYPKNAQKS